MNEEELKSMLDNLLTQTGETDKLMELLSQRLVQSGWKDEVRLECGRIIRENGVENLDLDTLVQKVTPFGRESIPSAVKMELLERIKVQVTKELERRALV